MCDHIGTIAKTVKATITGASKSGIGTKDKLTAGKVLYDFCFQRLQSGLFILISLKDIERDGNPISVHKKPHAHNRVRFMIFPLSIALHTGFFFNLKVIVRTVVIEDLLVPRMNKVGVAI